MFDMGFINDVRDIIRHTPQERQTLLFSATLSKDVEGIARQHMKNPETVAVQEYVDTAKLTQQYYEIDQRDKYSLLVHLLKEHHKGLTLVFCGTKRMVDALATNLNNAGINARALHGGISQHQRQQALNALHTHHTNILIASDIAARGIDVKNLALVINYDIPKTSKDYVHRIGRTARAGEEGKVVSLLTDRDHENFRAVLRDRSLHIAREELPPFTRVPFLARPQSRGREEGGWQRRGPPRHGGGQGGHRGPFRGRQGPPRGMNRGRTNYRQGREGQRSEA